MYFEVFNNMTNPLFMWAGGKRKMLKHYQPFIPDIKSITYVEPFFGGGAMFGALNPQKAIINDVNWEIIDLYRWVKESPLKLLELATYLQEQYLPLSKEERKKFYYDLRACYWESERGLIETSAILFFLLKTCFNGIWQGCAQSNGRFGTPCGLLIHDKPFIDESLVKEWAAMLDKAQLLSEDFSKINVPRGAFVFCDPPYRDSFTSYNTVFGDDKQIELLNWAHFLAQKKNCKVWVSNRDCDDGFWENIGLNFKLHKFPITYTAGRRKHVHAGGEKTFEAKPATEVLMIFGG